jgi:phosphocarrier protein
MSKITLELVVNNVEGLHMRPMMKFVDCANQFRANVAVSKPKDPSGDIVDGKSVMNMMTVVDVQGTPYKIDIDGDDAEAAAEAFKKLFEEKFGEE